MDFNIARLLIGQQGLTSHSVLARRFIPDSFGFSLGLHRIHLVLHSVCTGFIWFFTRFALGALGFALGAECKTEL